jgi:hypothetical protein
VLKMTPGAEKEFSPEQQQAILRHAAGLLVSWIAPSIGHLITPDVEFDNEGDESVWGDWEAQEKAGQEPIAWQAHGEVVSVIDQAFRALARQAGFEGTDQEVWLQATHDTVEQDGHRVIGKYPTFPTTPEQREYYASHTHDDEVEEGE